MSNYYSYHEYLPFEEIELFTVVCLPYKGGKFPTIIYRTPYVDAYEDTPEQDIAQEFENDHRSMLDKGYAFVYQHCRGRGKSTGEHIPYLTEREDGLFLQDWIRKQDFYNGELLLSGGSYTSTVHLMTAPFAPDIKGAILQVQDSDRYNLFYRNGMYRFGASGLWKISNYKRKQIDLRDKNYDMDIVNTLPFIDYPKIALGESCELYEQTMLHPDRNDEFWNTKLGGVASKGALDNANIPILLVTGFYDFYTGGMFDMWNNMNTETKAKSALVVHPYAHRTMGVDKPIEFPNGDMAVAFPNLSSEWFSYVLKGTKPPVENGKVTYYKLFDNRWHTDDFKTPEKSMTFMVGEGKKTYTYNPFAPAKFKGSLSSNLGGTAWQDAPNSRYDILSFYTPEFTEDTCIKGKMKAKLRVSSDCEDTCFYMRISLKTEDGDLGLRDDINQISNFNPDYKPGEVVDMDFSFDEHSLLVKKGQALRIDISSSCYPYFVRHTNQKGLFSLQTTAKVAHNTVYLEDSSLTIFVE